MLVVTGAVFLSSCFTTSADFKNDAEDFIDDEVAEELGVDFVDVECVEPQTQDVGTRFECVATNAAGDEWVFDNEITAENEFTVNIERAP